MVSCGCNEAKLLVFCDLMNCRPLNASRVQNLRFFFFLSPVLFCVFWGNKRVIRPTEFQTRLELYRIKNPTVKNPS